MSAELQAINRANPYLEYVPGSFPLRYATFVYHSEESNNSLGTLCCMHDVCIVADEKAIAALHSIYFQIMLQLSC